MESIYVGGWEMSVDVRSLVAGRVIAAILFISGVGLVLYPFWHETAHGVTMTCGPPVFVAFPRDPWPMSDPRRAVTDRCLDWAWWRTLGAAGMIVASTFTLSRVRRRERELSTVPGLPPRPDPHVIPKPLWRTRILGPDIRSYPRR